MRIVNTNILLGMALVTCSLTAVAQKVLTTKTNPVFVDVGNNVRGIEHHSGIELTWISPIDPYTTTNKNKIALKVGINSSKGIGNVKVLVNDVSPDGSRGFGVVKEKQGYEQFQQLIEKDIYLNNGENTITITASNESGEELREERLVKFDELSVASLGRTDYALLFATDEYDSWENLTNPINDARTIAEELEQHYDFNVELVTNPTNAEILIKLKEYAQKSYQTYDQLFIFIAGHGQYDEIYGEGYIVGKNSEKEDIAKTSYISHSVLRNAINNIPNEHIFVAMDACFGGTFDPSISQAGARGNGEGVYRELNQAEFIKRKLKFKTRQYLTSGGKEYVPDGRPGMHSPFARKVIEGLRTYGGTDKVLTLGELFGFVERIVPEPRAGEFGDNTPGSDFVFVAQ